MNNLATVGTISEFVDPLSSVTIGDWYWVAGDLDDEDYSARYEGETLWCVQSIGSNHIQWRKEKDRSYEYFKMRFEDFAARCRKEEHWKQHFQNEATQIQASINVKMLEMMNEGKALCLLKGYNQEDPASLLPSVVTASPVKHKDDLVAFRDDKMPAIQKEIDELAGDLAVCMKHTSLPDKLRFEQLKEALKVVDDRIFNVELYCGLQEEVHRIQEGEPADINTSLSIRQQMLFMDEETLFDFDDGGMDITKLTQFDEWVTKPETLARILPEQKGIVAFRVRRKEKDYGRALTIGDAIWQLSMRNANFQTYLLIRNGENVYRIATEINFSPRLVPLTSEIKTHKFERKIHSYGRGKDTYEDVTPEDLDYDEHVEELEKQVNHYNRMVILMQGLLDRTKIFSPHPIIKLTRDEDMETWVRCIRDEERALPCNRVTFEEYRDQLNKTVKKGKQVYSCYVPDSMGRFIHTHNYVSYTALENEVVHRPSVCEVESVKRDKSSVMITWKVERQVWGDWDYRGKWVDSHTKEVTRHLEVPMKELLNVTDYNIGDFKMFLCDRALNGKYLEWAHVLLTAEQYKLKEAKQQ